MKLLLTGYDSGIKELGDLCLPSKLAYAARWGSDSVVLRDADYPHELGHPAFQKLRHIEHYLFARNYEVVFWMDADSLITNPEIGPSSFLVPEAQHLIVSEDYKRPEEDSRPRQLQWSSGHMIWTRSPRAGQLLSLAQRHTESAYSGLWDQDALQAVVTEQPHLQPRVLPCRAMNAVLPGLTNTTRADWEPCDMLCHFTGIAREDRPIVVHRFIENCLVKHKPY